MDVSARWKPRLSIDITEEQYAEHQKHIPWGLKNKLVLLFLDEIVRISKAHGVMALGLMASRGITIVINGVTHEPGGIKTESAGKE